MAYPLRLSLSLARYLLGRRLTLSRRFPLVLMLEPTFQCNLSCAGCGRIREYADTLGQRLSREECLEAVEESGAPVVAITGGEPLVLPDMDRIVAEIIQRRRFVILCSNGLLVKQSLHKFQPSPYLSFGIHLDGLEATHDAIACRPGVFGKALESIEAAKSAGFRVYTNTTIYKGTDLREIEELFRMLGRVGVDGVMVSPAFSYQEVRDDLFLTRKDVHGLFQTIYGMKGWVSFYNSPLYLQFLAGQRQLSCTPWGNPTRNVKGWKRPCYLITDGHATSFAQLMKETPWENYGTGRDPRCQNCMVHSGFEASAVLLATRSPRAMWQMLKWNLTAPRAGSINGRRPG
ncbi:MAG: adenosyl-hopene transferase HpnH [Chloroflexi bacterium]|nr:adenosyl-hopene transferase HpnH [Chloroflexota bacterium]